MTVVDAGASTAIPEATGPSEISPTAPETGLSKEADKSPLDWAKQFKIFSKKEAQMRVREQALEAREKSTPQFESIKKLAAVNPIAAIKELGLDYDRLTKFLLEGGENSPEVRYKELDQKFENHKKETEEAKKQETEAKMNHFIKKYKNDIASFVDSNKTEYELLSLRPDSSQTVYETIEAYYKQHGRELSFKEAADMCEKFFEETELDRILNLKKVQSKLAPKKEEPKMEDIRPYLRPNTLSNTMHAAENKTDVAPKKELSRDELIEQSLRLVQRR